MKRGLIWGGIGVAILAILVVGGLAFTRSSPGAAASGGSATVTKEDLEVLVKSQGLIVAATTIEVKSRASGYVQAIPVKAGDRVTKDRRSKGAWPSPI